MNDQKQSPAEPGIKEESSFLFEFVINFGREKWLVLGFTLFLMVAVAGYSVQLPNIYTAKTLLLPPQQGQSSAGSALAALGVVSMGLGGGVGSKSSEELYVSLLKSESVSDNLIERFELKVRYEAKTIFAARSELAKRVVVTADRKTGLIRVQTQDQDPVFAANLANAYSEELRRVMDRIAITEASQRRLFFERQTTRAKELLAQAELAFKAAQDKYGIDSIDVRALGDLRASSELRAQIMSRDIQIQSMSVFAGPENSDLKRLRSEIAILRAQLEKVEHGSGSVGPISNAALENQRAYREVKYQEALLSGLITQAELARGDEARQAPLVQQVDVARVPDQKSGPNRSSMVLAAGGWGLLLGLVCTWVGRWVLRTSGARRSSPRWRLLRAAWAIRTRK